MEQELQDRFENAIENGDAWLSTRDRNASDIAIAQACYTKALAIATFMNATMGYEIQAEIDSEVAGEQSMAETKS